jgi:prepilin-type N-terminal cleavage/methylation domain-containing protein
MKKGFTLIELLVVVAIIGVLSVIVITYLGDAKSKGTDAAIKSNMINAQKQGEIFYNTNTATPYAYTNVCTSGTVGGAITVYEMLMAAGRGTGLSSYSTNAIGTATTATCNDSAGAWAAQVPLKGSTSGSPKMWCIDSTGKSKQETVNSLTTATTYTCI